MEVCVKRFLAVALASFALPLSAANLFVGPTGSDLSPLCASGTPCLTIQSAVNKATAGDTIFVAAGTYDATTVTVNKTLTLQGAQAGVDARTRSAAESIVHDTATGTTPFNVTASNVVIDGFTVEGNTSTSNFGFGILTGLGTTGTQILNNIIQNNIAGISLANTGVTQMVIRHNLIRNNNQPGPVSGTGLYSDQFSAGGILSNVLIADNLFSNNQGSDVFIVPTSVAFAATNITVQDNASTGAGNFAVFATVTSSSILRNVVSGSAGSTIVVGGSTNVTVAGNLLSGGSTRGIRIFDLAGTGVNTGLLIHHNSITNFGGNGIDVDPTSVAATVNAENNWFGCNAGPGQPGCETAIGDVDTNPWLVLTITAIPNTVTVGGTSSVTASLRRNSDGVDTSGQGLVGDGLSVAFAAVDGTIAPSPVTMTSANAASTFTATTSGSGSASATLHSQTVAAPITVVGNPTSTTLSSTPNPSAFGQSVTFTASVTSGTPGTITGTVTFTIDGIPGAPVTLNGAGQALFSTSSLTPGSHTVTATFNGDATFAPSTSNQVAQFVNAPFVMVPTLSTPMLFVLFGLFAIAGMRRLRP
jgi:Bacterial Ig-like domain (group 3)/Right handed beta helix region/Periplasmic copper-binding protein (NosD)